MRQVILFENKRCKIVENGTLYQLIYKQSNANDQYATTFDEMLKIGGITQREVDAFRLQRKINLYHA